ncbi:DMT family transporter [Kiloniella antarctica]|uniref:DMT family transporter n=1 Tax=Kiloniella antarctica TaxID=1550907 RepID=A0ABW5BNN2_9PROT
MSSPRWAFVFLISAQLLWAGNFIVGRAISTEISPLTLSYWRWTIALICLLPFTVPALIKDWHLYRPVIGKMVVLGLLSVASFNTLLYYGLQTTPATNAALFNSMIPVIIIAISFLVFRERIRPLQILGIVISFCGVLTLLVRGNPQNLVGLSLNSGDFFILGAVLSWSLYSALMRWKPVGVSPFSFILLNVLIGEVVLTVLYMPGWIDAAPLEFTQNNLLAVFYAGIPVSIIAFLCWNEGVKHVGASLAGQFIHLLPIFAATLAIFLLGEQPEYYHGAGALLIGFGVWLSVRKSRRAKLIEPI